MTQLSDTPQKSGARCFGRRKGRPLRERKSMLMRELLPSLQIVLPEKGRLNPFSLFAVTPEQIGLEIGFGGGEHLAADAEKNPATGFIGCEPFVNGIAGLLDHIEKKKLSNIRIFPNDARLLLDALPDASISRCAILFADPWPRARHAERRFVGPENIPRLARVMQNHAELRLATDDAQLAAWMRMHMDAAHEFALEGAFTERPADWHPTRYEEKARIKGRKPVYLKYVRNIK